MRKYDTGVFRDFSEPGISRTFDLSHFPELRLVGSMAQIRNEKQNTPFSVTKGGSISSRALVHGGVVYFGANDYNFYAVDAKTGRELWRFPTGGPVSVWGSASIWRDRVLFSSYDGNIYCLSLDGKEVFWRLRLKEAIGTTPLVYRDAAYFGSGDGNFYCISPKTGGEIWRLGIGTGIFGDAVVHGESVIFGARGGVYSVSLDGRLLWKFPLNGYVDFRVAVHGDRIFFGCSDGNVYCISAEGRTEWKFPTGGPILGDCRYRDGLVLTCSFDGNAYCLDAEGNLLWRFGTGDAVTASPELYRGRVVFASFNKNLYCVTTRGELLWKLPVEVLSYQTIEDGVVYASGWDCKLYAISVEGEMLWEFRTSIAYQSELEFAEDVSFEVVVPAGPGTATKERPYKGGGERIETVRYGDFRPVYDLGLDRDYLGGELDREPRTAYQQKKRIYRN